MGYQPSAGRTSPSRPRGFDRQKKAKAKRSSTHHAQGPRYEERGKQTLKDAVDRALTALDNLGAQTFAMQPFHQHYERWLRSLASVIDDFEASAAVKVDEAFRQRRAELFSAVEAGLKAEQDKETARGSKILGIHGSKDLLMQSEREHEEKIREYTVRRGERVKALSAAVDALRTELDEASAVKPGRFERFTHAKAQAEEGVRANLASAENVLESAKATFADELARLQGEYEKRKGEILEKVAAERREIDALAAEAEIDDSVELRRVACEEFAEAVNDLVKRIEAKPPEGV